MFPFVNLPQMGRKTVSLHNLAMVNNYLTAILCYLPLNFTEPVFEFKHVAMFSHVFQSLFPRRLKALHSLHEDFRFDQFFQFFVRPRAYKRTDNTAGTCSGDDL